MLKKYRKERPFNLERSFFKQKLFNRKGIPVLLLMLLLSIGIGVYMSQDSKVKATWIWDLKEIEGSIEENIAFAKEQEVTLIYLHVSLKGLDEKRVQAFVEEASENDIQVYALGGDPNWALRKNQESLSTFMSIVKDYNQKVSGEARFKGVHMDIEPYLLPEWESNKKNVITQWMNNVTLLRKEAKQGEQDLQLSGDFPFWVNDLEVPGKNQHLSEWMLDQLDSMTIMAYRDYSEGKNGIKHIASPLVEEAANQGKSVVIAVNVIKTDEGSYTTFYDSPPKQMEQELSGLSQSFSGHPGYAGIAIHDYSYWKQYKKKHQDYKEN